MNRLCRAIYGLIAIGLVSSVAAPLAAQDAPAKNTTGHGITVSASGEALAKPDVVEIDLMMSAGAELGSDAAAKFRGSLERVNEAFAKLKIEKLKIEDRGTRIASNSPAGDSDEVVQVNGINQAGGLASTAITKSLRLTVSGIDGFSDEELTKLVTQIVDAAKDAGATPAQDPLSSMTSRMMGYSLPNSSVRFAVSDYSAAQNAATEKAFQAAKKKAERLAALAGVKLGPVIHMEEGAAVLGNDQQSIQTAMLMAMTGQQSTQEASKLSSPVFTPLPVRVTMRVQFAIQTDGK